MSSTDRFRPNLSEDPQALGREMARGLQLILRTARTHGWSNEASQNALEHMVTTVNGVMAARGDFGIHIASDFVYLDDVRLRMENSGYGDKKHAVDANLSMKSRKSYLLCGAESLTGFVFD